MPSLTAAAGLCISYGFIRPTGMLFSINVNLLHLYLLLALLSDKKWGGFAVPGCLGLLVYLYWHTPPAGPGLAGNPLYALAVHSFSTLMLGGAVAYGRYSENQGRLEIERLQLHRISLLDEAVAGGAPMSLHIASLVVRSFARNPDSPLSAREQQVLQSIAQGKTYTRIAADLFINKETVRSHIRHI